MVYKEKYIDANATELLNDSELCVFYHPQYISNKSALNLVSGSNASITGEIIPIISDKDYITKLENVFPYINFATIISGTKGEIILNKTLKFVLSYLRRMKYSIKIKHEINAFISTLGHHLSNINPRIITQETLDYIHMIMMNVEKTKEKVFNMLIYTVNIWINTDPCIYFYYWEMFRNEFSSVNNKLNMEIVIAMMMNLEFSFTENSCCEKSMQKFYSPMTLFLLTYIIKKSPKNPVSMLLSVLMKRPSHCLFISLVDLLGKLLTKQAEAVKEFLMLQGPMLLFNLAKNYEMDIKIECIRILTSLKAVKKTTDSIKEFIRPAFVILQKEKPNRRARSIKSGSMIKSYRTKITRQSSQEIIQCKLTQKVGNERESFKERAMKSDYQQLYNFIMYWTIGRKLDTLSYGCESLIEEINLEQIKPLMITNIEALYLLCHMEKKMNSFEFSSSFFKNIQALNKGSVENTRILSKENHFILWLTKRYYYFYIQNSESLLIKLVEEILTDLICKELLFDNVISFPVKYIICSKEITMQQNSTSKIINSIVKANLVIWKTILNKYVFFLKKHKPISIKSSVWRNVPTTFNLTAKLILINCNDKENSTQVIDLAAILFNILTMLCNEETVEESKHSGEKLDSILAQGKKGELNEMLPILLIEPKLEDDTEYLSIGKAINILQVITMLSASLMDKCNDLVQLNLCISRIANFMNWFLLLAEYVKTIGDSNLVKELSFGYITNLTNMMRQLVKYETNANMDIRDKLVNVIVGSLNLMDEMIKKVPEGNTVKLYKIYLSDIELSSKSQTVVNIISLYNSHEKLRKLPFTFDSVAEVLGKVIRNQVSSIRLKKHKKQKTCNNQYVSLSRISDYCADALIDFSQQAILWQQRCEYKWESIQKQLKQWSGGWRNSAMFKTMRLPRKLSNHFFSNGCRCVLTLRTTRTKLPGNSGSFNKFEEKIIPEEFFTQMRKITQISSSNFRLSLNSFQAINTAKLSHSDITSMIFYSMEKKIRKDLPQPVECERVTNLYIKKGSFLFYLKTAKKGYILFIEKLKVQIEIPKKGEVVSVVNKAQRIKKIKMLSIKSIIRKCVIEGETAVEIACWTGESILFNFLKEDCCEKICTKLIKLRNQYCPYLKYPIYNPLKILAKSELTKDWMNRKCSTFDYILQLNNLSGRSFNNLSQYPILPWTLSDYNSEALKCDDSIYRNFSKNLGMTGNPVRAEEFKQKFYKEDLTGQGHFNFGSHYSTPGIVYQFLMRLYPIFEAYVIFFKGLDIPDRMFHAIEQTWNNTQNDITDVRELIPEFFSLPEVFVNYEHIPFGIREDDNEKVNNVLLPKWAKGNCYSFVEVMRESLESSYVTSNIHTWIDLIFGSKQRGKEAENSFNVYPILCYDAKRVLSETKDESLRNDYRLQAHDWGQIPQQLFVQKHPECTPKNCFTVCDKNTELKVFSEKEEEGKDTESAIIYIREVKTSALNSKFLLVTLGGRIIEGSILEISESANALDKGKVVLNALKLSNKSYKSSFSTKHSKRRVILDAYSNYPIIIMSKRNPPIILQPGILDGSILITVLTNPEKQLIMDVSSFNITTLAVDKNERIFIAGNSIGELLLFMVEDNIKLTETETLWDHKEKLNCINISEAMCMFATVGNDGCINLYSLSYKPKLLRVIFHPQQKISFNSVQIAYHYRSYYQILLSLLLQPSAMRITLSTHSVLMDICCIVGKNLLITLFRLYYVEIVFLVTT